PAMGTGPSRGRRAPQRRARPAADRSRLARSPAGQASDRCGALGRDHVSGVADAVGNVMRPSLLFLCQTLPYPPDGGVWIRTYHVLRLLARAFDITALCFERAATSGNGAASDLAASRDALGRFAAVEVSPISQKHSRLRCAWDHLRSVALRRAYTAYMYTSRDYDTRLA